MRTRNPNIVMIISDQQRYDTIGYRNRNIIRIPHLDNLTEKGIFFNKAFCTTPICSPSRASILTGLFPHTHGMVANHQARPGADQMTLKSGIPLLPDYLSPQGYVSAYSGKWHLATGNDRKGFLDIHGKRGDHDVDRDEDNDFLKYAKNIGIKLIKKLDGNQPDPLLYDSARETGPSLFSLADHPSSFCCTKAVNFIYEHTKNSSSPFCLVYSTHEPHPPFISPEPFYSMYDPAKIILPDNFAKASGKRWLNRNGTRIRGISEYTEWDLRIMWAAYLGAVSFVDHLTGRILSALYDCDIYDDTLIFFLSDHGEMLGSHGLFHKGAALCEELVRIPLIMKLPDNKYGGSSVDSLVSGADILPSILDICGIDHDGSFQGKSFKPSAEGNDENARPFVVSEYHSSNWTDPVSPLRMWRTEKWKYIESAHGDNELYDIKKDPSEENNLFDRPECIAQTNSLKRDLYNWMRQTGDTFPDVVLPQMKGC